MHHTNETATTLPLKLKYYPLTLWFRTRDESNPLVLSRVFLSLQFISTVMTMAAQTGIIFKL